MLYLDYSRDEWEPNVHGGRENLEAMAFLQEMNATVYREVPGVVTIAEESTAWPGVTRPDRKSTRLNSSHANISYAVFCLKKKKLQYLIYYRHTITDPSQPLLCVDETINDVHDTHNLPANLHGNLYPPNSYYPHVTPPFYK